MKSPLEVKNVYVRDPNIRYQFLSAVVKVLFIAFFRCTLGSSSRISLLTCACPSVAPMRQSTGKRGDIQGSLGHKFSFMSSRGGGDCQRIPRRRLRPYPRLTRLTY